MFMFANSFVHYCSFQVRFWTVNMSGKIQNLRRKCKLVELMKCYLTLEVTKKILCSILFLYNMNEASF